MIRNCVADDGTNQLSLTYNKLKSLKVAQVKDEMYDYEDDGCDVVW